MNEAFIQNPQNDVNDQDGHNQQPHHSLERCLKSLGCSLKIAADRCRKQGARKRFDFGNRISQRDFGFEIE